GAKRVDIATLFYKPFSKVKPNYFGYETRAWVIFPHEIRETIELLGKKWLASGLGKKEVTARFLKLGLSEDEVDFFVRIV
ncbi:hypothetical protein HY030_03440, partial [Candidatus Gottesmanbacteria bacterium]|nr:hypothetical protein [Candidatus Gottesmanbacteria bacterium]